MVGTDAPLTFVYPGFAVHRELALFVEAGLSPYEALRAATVTPARELRLDDAGSVEVGKRADLLLVEGNPLESIANAGRIAGVVAAGVWMSSGRLDEALETLARVYEPGARQVARLLPLFEQERPEALISGWQAMDPAEDGVAPFVEDLINTLGYRHLGDGEITRGVEVLRLNAETFPESANTWDSLGEGLMLGEDYRGALENYRRSLELDPDNENARQFIAWIERWSRRRKRPISSPRSISGSWKAPTAIAMWSCETVRCTIVATICPSANWCRSTLTPFASRGSRRSACDSRATIRASRSRSSACTPGVAATSRRATPEVAGAPPGSREQVAAALREARRDRGRVERKLVAGLADVDVSVEGLETDRRSAAADPGEHLTGDLEPGTAMGRAAIDLRFDRLLRHVEIRVDVAAPRVDPQVALERRSEGHIDIAVEGRERHRLVRRQLDEGDDHLAVGRVGQYRSADVGRLDPPVGVLQFDLSGQPANDQVALVDRAEGDRGPDGDLDRKIDTAVGELGGDLDVVTVLLDDQPHPGVRDQLHAVGGARCLVDLR